MQEREVVLTKREVEARLVPAGTEIMIPSDTFVTITQSLGGSFTVAVNGNLARIEGHDADALGKQPLESSFETPEDGTINENQVWEALRAIPLGETQSYGVIAKAIGRPEAVRAVATACASNQAAVVIPCHRVVRGNGTSGGYRWGAERKKALLNSERNAASGN